MTDRLAEEDQSDFSTRERSRGNDKGGIVDGAPQGARAERGPKPPPEAQNERLDRLLVEALQVHHRRDCREDGATARG